jgi:hypothetical protein
MDLPQAEIIELTEAKSLLESPGFSSKITNLISKPIEYGFKKMPKGSVEKINKVCEKTLEKVFYFTFKGGGTSKHLNHSREWWDEIGIMATGAIGGFVGLPALIVELPVSVSLIMQSISGIASNYGEDLSSAESKLSCIEVLHLGSDREDKNYLDKRLEMDGVIKEASDYIASEGFSDIENPKIKDFLSKVSSKFSITASDMAVIDILPMIGDITGATVNVLFMLHFQNTAKGHFIIRKLERKYGGEIVHKAYKDISLA